MKAMAVVLCAAAAVSCSRSIRQQAAAPSPEAGVAALNDFALPNVHSIGTLISGGVPGGDAGFDRLEAMGVKTIISVDGASPDVARAAARGMRYVHIPITYADVPEKQRLELARAIRDLPGPVYIHCHHGKHRSPAAAAAAAVALDMATPDEGVAFMMRAGTAPNYAGLYRCVAEARVASAAAVNEASDAFPAVQKPEGVIAAMVEAEAAFENLGRIRSAGWVTPQDHPDLVPAAEAGRLADQLRFSAEDPRAAAWGAEYARQLAEAIRRASELEMRIARGEARAQLEAAWSRVGASCKECHAMYRDGRR